MILQLKSAGDQAADSTTREWFTAAELAELNLPGLASDKRSVNRRAREENWQYQRSADGEPLARPRTGRGGGVEFHFSLLPALARLALAERGVIAPIAAPIALEAPREGSWRWYEAQSAKVKDEAQRRAGIVAEIDLLETAGMTRTGALAEVNRRHGVATSTLWTWLRMIEGVQVADRLPALAPRRTGGGREAEIDGELWDLFKSDYLRMSGQSGAESYRKLVEVARQRGLSVPSEKTCLRKLKAEVPASVIKLARKGEEALRRSLPAQRRSVAELHAMEVINMDGHRFDVFVTPQGGGKPVRPILIGIQDVYSRKLLAWRIGTSETAGLTRLVFADLFERFGLPRKAVMDNGRAFASKWITGGVKNRYRFTVRDEEPTGLLTGLGIDVKWTLPYRGQSKPIERAWRDMCDSISRCAAFDGAYTGNNTLNKPENYGRRAVAWDVFVDEVERGIRFHNARPGRKTETARGRSFDEVFAESYAAAPVTKATKEQMRLALLMGENVRVHRETGEIGLYGNRYWHPFLSEMHGQKVTVRFDPGNLWKGLHVYALGGEYLGEAELLHDAGFEDQEMARDAARLVGETRKAAKAMLEAERRLDAAQVAQAQRQIGAAEPELPEPAAIRPVRLRGQTAAALKPVLRAEEAENDIVAALGVVSLKLVE